MSNLFNYEIDERNLRVQLKNLELPLREDAWEKFENYAQANQIDAPKKSWRSFEINLNRNVVLPAIFGVIIVLFSFMLYSFVTIQNDETSVSPQENELVKANELTTAPAQINDVVPQPENKVVDVKIETAAVSATTVQVENKLATEQNAAPEQKVEVSSNETQSNNQTVDSAQIQVQKKKGRRQREEEAISAIRPTVVTEEEPSVEIPQ